MLAAVRVRLQGVLWDWRARRHPSPALEDLVRKYAPGRSFVDVGGMWGISGRMAFLAEEAGATQVTLLDAMPPTEEFQAELDARGSKVRFVLADLYDAATPELIGKHDVVWCTGLMYHAPSPFLAMERLWAMTGELLILGNKVVPETPGLSQAAILYPGISGWQRRIHERFGGGGVRAPFEPDPIRSYANWWWGLSPSACRALVGEPRIVESASYPLRATHDHYVLVARAN